MRKFRWVRVSPDDLELYHGDTVVARAWYYAGLWVGEVLDRVTGHVVHLTMRTSERAIRRAIQKLVLG